MNTKQEERLIAALERIADALDPPPEKVEDRQFKRSARLLRRREDDRARSFAEAERRMRA